MEDNKNELTLEDIARLCESASQFYQAGKLAEAEEMLKDIPGDKIMREAHLGTCRDRISHMHFAGYEMWKKYSAPREDADE